MDVQQLLTTHDLKVTQIPCAPSTILYTFPALSGSTSDLTGSKVLHGKEAIQESRGIWKREHGIGRKEGERRREEGERGEREREGERERGKERERKGERAPPSVSYLAERTMMAFPQLHQRWSSGVRTRQLTAVLPTR